jgi:hypothetical protein
LASMFFQSAMSGTCAARPLISASGVDLIQAHSRHSNGVSFP